jgi:HK97 family phage major capsid protein
MAADGVTTVTLGSADIEDLTWKDFRDAVYKVSAEERKDCARFLHETVLNHIANIEDDNGRPIWRRPIPLILFCCLPPLFSRLIGELAPLIRHVLCT